MDKLDEAVGEAQSRCAALEAEPVLVGLLAKAILHLFEGIALRSEARQEVTPEVEPQGCIARILLQDVCAEVPCIGALEALYPVVQTIIIAWRDDIGVEGKEIAQRAKGGTADDSGGTLSGAKGEC